MKEYDYLGRVKFEGDLLKGRRNGKGKEYYIYGNIIFEGEYSNENRSKGIEYNNKGKIIFEGEYLKGKKYKGKEIKYIDNDYLDNVKSFELEFDAKNGDKIGHIKQYDPLSHKIKYEGGFVNGKRNGKGKEYYDDGALEFEGEYINGKRNGK